MDGFGPEILGDPPEVKIGVPFIIEISTDCPNTKLFYATYKNNERVGDVQSLTTGDDGKAFIGATPQAPPGPEFFILSIVQSRLHAFIVLVEADDFELSPEDLFILAFITL